MLSQMVTSELTLTGDIELEKIRVGIHNRFELIISAVAGVAGGGVAVQVTEGCRERGELMADVWIGYTTVLETVMARMSQLCLQDRDRSARSNLCSMPVKTDSHPKIRSFSCSQPP